MQNRLREEKLKEVLKRLQKTHSLFNNHLLEGELKRRFKNELLEKIKTKNKPEYVKFVEPFFRTNKLDKYWERVLENEKLPFVFLNNWFGRFVSAVDGDINNQNPDSMLWNKANRAFNAIPEKHRSTPRSDYYLVEKPQPNRWFRLIDGKYSYIPLISRTEKRKITNSWEAYKKRQGEEIGTRYFYNFRHNALMRLIEELK